MTTYDTPEAFRRAWQAAQRAAKRTRRPKEPTLRIQPTTTTRTGFSGLIRRGWAVASDARGMRLTRGEQDTGWCADELAACDAANRLEQAHAR